MKPNTHAIKQTKEFVKQAFIANPHYSFNHRSVMYNHSVNVQEYAMKIAHEIKCNTTIVAISALLHDIGKTHKASSEVLHKKHEDFNLLVSQDFLKSLNLPLDEYTEICKIINYESQSEEMKIVKDADVLALYADKTLYMLLIERIYDNGLEYKIDDKINKYNKLYFEISKQLGKANQEQMKKDREEYSTTQQTQTYSSPYPTTQNSQA